MIAGLAWTPKQPMYLTEDADVVVVRPVGAAMLITLTQSVCYQLSFLPGCSDYVAFSLNYGFISLVFVQDYVVFGLLLLFYFVCFFVALDVVVLDV